MHLNASSVTNVKASTTSLSAEAGKVHTSSSYKTGGWPHSRRRKTMQINAILR